MSLLSTIKRFVRATRAGSVVLALPLFAIGQDEPSYFRISAKKMPNLLESVRATVSVRIDREWKLLCEIYPDDSEFTKVKHPKGNTSEFSVKFESPWLDSPYTGTHTGGGDLIIEVKPKKRIYTLSENYSRALEAGDASAASAIAFLAAEELKVANDPGAEILQRESWALLGQSIGLEGEPLETTKGKIAWITPELKDALIENELSISGRIGWGVYERVAGADFSKFARGTLNFPVKGDPIAEPLVTLGEGKWNPIYVKEIGLPAGGEQEALKRRLKEAESKEDFGIAALIANDLAFRLRSENRELSLRYQKQAWDWSAKALGIETPAWKAINSDAAIPSEELLKATTKFKRENHIPSPAALDSKFYRKLSGSEIGIQLTP